jgi:Family of unknown function (DUF6498)
LDETLATTRDLVAPAVDPAANTTVAPVSTWALLASNVAAPILALVLHWPLATLLWPYWFQSVVIGYFSRKRMLAVPDFSTAGMSMGESGTPVPETEAGRRQMVNFFTLHYGFFHLGYLVFLLSMTHVMSALDWLGLAISAAGFVWSHKLSYDRNSEADLLGKQSLARMMLLPYLRIVPMHFSIMLGVGLTRGNFPLSASAALLIFFALKTVADLGMHRFEHKLLRRAAS